MSLKGLRTYVKHVESCMRLMDSITCSTNGEYITKVESIGKYVMIRLKWNATIFADRYKIAFSFSSCKQDLMSKDSIVKMHVISEFLNFTALAFNAHEEWSDWQPMGYIEKPLGEICLCDTYIFAYEVERMHLSLMLYNDKHFTDFHLTAPEGTVAVHKSCLAAHSDVFKTMLAGEWKETSEGKMNINGVNLKTLQHLKDYMYLGILPDEELRTLLIIARQYLMEDLQKHCIQKLAFEVMPEDLYSLTKFACEHNIPELAYAMLQITLDSVITKAYDKRNIAEMQMYAEF